MINCIVLQVLPMMLQHVERITQNMIHCIVLCVLHIMLEKMLTLLK